MYIDEQDHGMNVLYLPLMWKEVNVGLSSLQRSKVSEVVVHFKIMLKGKKGV